jgi:hypothetical protein
VLQTAKTYILFKQHILLAQQEHQNKEHTNKQTGYGLAAKKIEAMSENFANYDINPAAQEEKLASKAANNQALQDLNSQYMQLAKQFDVMTKWKNPATNQPQGPVPTTCTCRPTVNQGSYCWLHRFHVAPVHTSASC